MIRVKLFLFAALFIILMMQAGHSQNYLRDDGTFHSVVEGTTNGQFLYNNNGTLSGTTTLPSGSLGPTTSVVGNIAFWNSTDGTKLGAPLAFQSGNPGNAALYSTIASPGTGTAVNNAMQVSLGTPITSTEQWGGSVNGARLDQAIVGTATISTSTGSAYGVTGFGKSLGTALANVIGVGGWGYCAATNSSCWAGADSVHNADAPNTVPNVGFSVNSMIAHEFDISIHLLPGAVEPTIAQLFAIDIAGAGESSANQGTAVSIGPLSNTTSAKWATGFMTRAGAALTAFTAGPTAVSGNNLASQPFVFQSTGGTGLPVSSQMYADGSANILFNASSGLHNFGALVAPDATITTNQNTGATAATIFGGSPSLHLIGGDGNINQFGMDAFGAIQNVIYGRLAKGTLAAKTGVVSADVMLAVAAEGWDTTVYATGANMQYRPTETWSATAHGAEIAFRTVPNTTTTIADALVVRNSGGVTIGAPTGGDKGIGSLNAQSIFVNNAAVLTANQSISLTGDVTGSGTTAITTVLATAQPAVHTWALAQTFTVAPVFTDQSGSRTALGLGTAATQNTGTSGANLPFLNGTNTWSGTQTFSSGVLAATAPAFAGTSTGTFTLGGTLTINAYTLGGTISGGGNQINNIIIGASTPLAGTFTTLAGNTSVTSPIHAAAGTLTFESNGSTIAGMIDASQHWAFGANAAPSTGSFIPLVSVNANGSIVPYVGTGAAAQALVVGPDATNSALAFQNYGGQSVFQGFTSGGTFASKTALSAANIFNLQAFAWDGVEWGSASNQTPNANIAFKTSQTQAAGAHGTEIDFFTTPNSTASRAQAATIQNSGGFSVGTTTDPGIGALLVNKTYGAVPTVFGSLVTCNAGAKGFRAFITDELAAVAFNTVATGSGANNVPVFCDGTNWRIG